MPARLFRVYRFWRKYSTFRKSAKSGIMRNTPFGAFSSIARISVRSASPGGLLLRRSPVRVRRRFSGFSQPGSAAVSFHAMFANCSAAASIPPGPGGDARRPGRREAGRAFV